MFGVEINFNIEKIVFDVVELPLLVNGILGCPSLAKFMAAAHYAYNTLKMPGPMGVISIPSDKRDSVICIDKMYRDAVAVEAVKALAPAKEKKKVKKADEDPRKHASLECARPTLTCRNVRLVRTQGYSLYNEEGSAEA